MQQAVVNNTQRLIIIGDIKLIPGANYVEDFLVKKHKDLLEEVEEREDITLPKLEVEDDLDTSTLGGYNAKDAAKLIKETNDYDLLMKFQIEETAGKTRKTVLEAISAQIQVTKDALNPNKND